MMKDMFNEDTGEFYFKGNRLGINKVTIPKKYMDKLRNKQTKRRTQAEREAEDYRKHTEDMKRIMGD